MQSLANYFQAAQSKNRYWNLLKTLFQTSIFWWVFLWVFPQLILWIESYWKVAPYFNFPNLVAYILFVIFGMISIGSGITMSWLGKGTPLPTDCPNQLVVAGPYRYVRNPMAVSGVALGISVGLIYNSVFIILYAIAGGIIWDYLVRPIEEEDLEERFGESYLAYKEQIRCWIPTFKKKPQIYGEADC